MEIINKLSKKLVGMIITYKFIRQEFTYPFIGFIQPTYNFGCSQTNVYVDPYTGIESLEETWSTSDNQSLYMNNFKYRYEISNANSEQLQAIVLQNPICITESRWNSGNHNESSYTNGDYTRLQRRSIIYKDDGSWSMILGSSPINGVKGYEEKLTISNTDRGLSEVISSKLVDIEIGTSSDPFLFGHNIYNVINRHSIRKVI